MEEFNLDINNLVTEDEEKEFQKACRDIELLSLLCRPYDVFEEEVVDKPYGFKQKFGNTVTNTVDTTKTAMGIVGGVTDLKATGYKGMWDLAAKCMQLAGRVAGYVLKKAYELPDKISKLINGVMDIPANVRNKIRGNIKLYITINDFMFIYTHGIIHKIDQFIKQVDLLSKGETWTAFFKGRGVINIAKSVLSGDGMPTNDKKHLEMMNKLFKEIQRVKFTETVVEMHDMDDILSYFGDKQSIQFTDLQGNAQNCTYYEALQVLMKDIQSESDTLKKVREDFQTKVADTKASQEYASLSLHYQNEITAALNNISAVTSMIGEIIKCVIEDLKTLAGAVNTARKNANKITSKKKEEAPELINPDKKR